MVEVADVEVALKFPNVGVEVAVITPEELVERRELTATEESVRAGVERLVAVKVPKYPMVEEEMLKEARNMADARKTEILEETRKETARLLEDDGHVCLTRAVLLYENLRPFHIAAGQ